MIKDVYKMDKSMELYDKLMDISIDCEEDLNKFDDIFKEYGVTQVKYDYGCAFDSCGLDVYYYAVSYVYNNELEMFTGIYECC